MGFTPTPSPTPLYVHPSLAVPLSPTCRPPVQPRSLHTCPGLRSVAAARTGAASGWAITVRPCRAAAGPGNASPQPAAGPAPAPPPPHLTPPGGTPDDPPAGPAWQPHGRSPAGSDRQRQHPSAAAILETGRSSTESATRFRSAVKRAAGRGRAP